MPVTSDTTREKARLTVRHATVADIPAIVALSDKVYGEEGARNLASLARTKLILATADYQSAERCAEFIGNHSRRNPGSVAVKPSVQRRMIGALTVPCVVSTRP